MWVGSLITYCSPNWEVVGSVLEPSKAVVSLVYQLLDFALESPMATIEKGLVVEIVSRVSSKLLQQFSKSSLDWFGELYKEPKNQRCKFYLQVLSQRLYNHSGNQFGKPICAINVSPNKLHKETNLCNKG